LIAINAQRKDCYGASHAKTAAEAAEAAGSQRMFWQMHSTSFAADGPLTNGLLTAAAAAFGLNVPSFQKGEKP
jgi:protein-disulfide isomerase